jgi:hypothetical protein
VNSIPGALDTHVFNNLKWLDAVEVELDEMDDQLLEVREELAGLLMRVGVSEYSERIDAASHMSSELYEQIRMEKRAHLETIEQITILLSAIIEQLSIIAKERGDNGHI